MTSTGRAAPPEMQTASVDVSTSARWLSIAAYIVGTPSNTVTRSRAMISSARPASKRGRRVNRPPTAIVAFSAHVWPKAWKSGSAPSATIVSSKPNSATEASTLCVRLPCVSSAPFGVPVVPDV